MSISQSQFNEMQQRCAPKVKRLPALPVSPGIMVHVLDEPRLKITINGQIMGGKNNIIITRTGRRFPKKSWETWRDNAVEKVQAQLPASFKAIRQPVDVAVDYVAGDRRRRDFPAICDAIWHVLEMAGVVSDDTYLWPARSSRSYDKKNPRAVITFLT